MKSIMLVAGITLELALTPSAMAQAPTPALQPALAGVGFLVGEWSSGDGVVADTGETSSGRSMMTVEAQGAALLRRDHTELSKAGKSTGGFDQIMLIYPEAGTIHADYSDGAHVIHYVSAVVEAGKSVTFLSTAGQGPVFKLSYTLTTPKTLGVTFAVQPPGVPSFQPIATGTLTRK